MSVPSLARRRAVLEKPRQRAKVISLVLEGLSDEQVGKQLGVSRQAITAFRHRHADELSPLVAEVEKQIIERAITDKVQRIASALEDYERLERVIQARASDARYSEPGYGTGLMVHSLKQMGAGKFAVIVDEFKVDTAVLAERRAIRHEVGDELDQLPRGNLNINIDNRTQVLVRAVTGVDPEALG